MLLWAAEALPISAQTLHHLATLVWLLDTMRMSDKQQITWFQ
jgi:hypothetical protein